MIVLVAVSLFNFPLFFIAETEVSVCSCVVIYSSSHLSAFLPDAIVPCSKTQLLKIQLPYYLQCPGLYFDFTARGFINTPMHLIVPHHCTEQRCAQSRRKEATYQQQKRQAIYCVILTLLQLSTALYSIYMNLCYWRMYLAPQSTRPSLLVLKIIFIFCLTVSVQYPNTITWRQFFFLLHFLFFYFFESLHIHHNWTVCECSMCVPVCQSVLLRKIALRNVQSFSVSSVSTIDWVEEEEEEELCDASLFC